MIETEVTARMFTVNGKLEHDRPVLLTFEGKVDDRPILRFADIIVPLGDCHMPPSAGRVRALCIVVTSLCKVQLRLSIRFVFLPMSRI